MPFPKAIAAAQRSSLHGDVLEALDLVEPIHRGLADSASHLVALSADEFAELRGQMETAYLALARARQITDPEGV